MTSILRLFFKTLIIPYYILNAGFFLLSFILIFGIVHPPQLIFIHLSLIQGIIHSAAFTWVVLLLWMVYNLKCILFCVRIIKREEDTIFFNLQVIPAARQWILLFICHCILYLPVIIYSCFVVYIALQEGFLFYSAGLILFQLLMCISAVYIYYFNINFTWMRSLSDASFLPAVTLFHGQLRMPLFLLYYTFHSKKIIFFVIKLAGLFLLNVILGTEKNYFDLRDFVVVFFTIVLFHALLVYYYVELMEKLMSITRNLPVRRAYRFLLFLITYVLMLLPELFFILINGSHLVTLYQTAVFYIMAVAQLLLFTSILYVKSMRMKPYLQIIFCIYFASSILMLSGYYEVIGGANLVLAFVLFYKSFYRYEAAL